MNQNCYAKGADRSGSIRVSIASQIPLNSVQHLVRRAVQTCGVSEPPRSDMNIRSPETSSASPIPSIKYFEVASIRIDGEQAVPCIDEVHATALIGRRLGVV
jgi:hypothetical protein